MLFSLEEIWFWAKFMHAVNFFTTEWENLVSLHHIMCGKFFWWKIVVWSWSGKIDATTLLSGLLTCPRDWLQMLRSRLVTPRHRSVRFVRVIFRTRNVTRLGAGRDFLKLKRRYLTRDRIGLDWTWNFLQNIFHRLLGHRNFFLVEYFW